MVFRRRAAPGPPADDPLATLIEPWLGAASRVVAAAARFENAARRGASGPMQERLGVLGGEIRRTVEAAIALAQRAQAVDHAISTGELEAVSARLKAARRQGAAEEVELLSQQFASLNRLVNRQEEMGGELDRLALRIEAAVAKALELTLLPAGEDPAARVDNVLEELNALQSAMAELA